MYYGGVQKDTLEKYLINQGITDQNEINAIIGDYYTGNLPEDSGYDFSQYEYHGGAYTDEQLANMTVDQIAQLSPGSITPQQAENAIVRFLLESKESKRREGESKRREEETKQRKEELKRGFRQKQLTGPLQRFKMEQLMPSEISPLSYKSRIIPSLSYTGPKLQLNDYLRARPKAGISDDIEHEINMITFDRKSADVVVFGSFNYIIQKYGADIDLRESYFLEGTPDHVIKQFEEDLIRIVKNINKKKMHWFSEYKTGYDDAYQIDIGTLIGGYYYPDKDLLKRCEILHGQKLLSDNELSLITSILDEVKINNFNSVAYDIIYNIFRERRILRWTADEILKKKKNLPGNRYITLNEALRMKGHVKIDEIIVLNGNFIEITNFLFIGYKTKQGSNISINIDKEENLKNTIEELKKEIEKLYLSDFYYSPFKVVKRMFALARNVYLRNGNNSYAQDLDKLITFISSDTSMMYQIKSSLEAILRVMDVSRTFPKKTVNNQIDGLRVKLTNIVELDNDTINSLLYYIDLILSTDNKAKKMENISLLIKKLKEIINYFTIGFLNKAGFNPQPNRYYPTKMQYAKIRRTPEEVPQNNELIKLYNLYKNH